MIYNLAPTPTHAPEEPAFSPQKRHVVYLGQIIPEKGVFEFETYPNEAPKSVAHILGLVTKRSTGE